MTSRAIPAVLVAAATLLAGCLGAVDGPGDLQDAAPATTVRAGDVADLLDIKHEHGNASAHQVGEGVREVAYEPVVSDDRLGDCGTLEVTVQGDHAFVVLTCGPRSGFAIVDIADPARPEVRSTYFTPTPYVWDVKVSDDGDRAFIGIQGTPGLSYGVPVPPQDDQGVPFSGVQAVDVSDKTDPTFLASYPVYRGGHNVEHHTVDGRDIVMVTVNHFVTSAAGVADLPVVVEDPVQTRVQLLEFVPDGPGGPGFQPLSSYRYVPDQPVRSTEGAWYQTAHFPHDMTAKTHPVTGDELMYVAYWDAGVRIVDISDPADPTEVGTWTGFDAGQAGNIHYTEAFDATIDGRHYTVASPEFAPEDHDGLVHILDTTDPADPKKVGSWTYPEDVVTGTSNPGYLIFSAHNSDVHDGRIYQGAYHAGVWVLDIKDEGTPEDPATVGVYAPTPPADIADAFGGNQPNVWGTAYADGHVLVSDIATGLYVVETA